MTIAAQLNDIAEPLTWWARPLGASVAVASDPVHLFNLLAEKPGTARVAVMFEREEKRGEIEEASMVDRYFSVVVSRGRGFTQPGVNLTAGRAGEAPLYSQVEAVRQVLRAVQFEADTTEVTLDYRSCRPFPVPPEYLVDAYQIELSIGTVLPEPALPTPP